MGEQVVDKLKEIESNVMSALKDFQRATVERIDALFRHNVKRILVSDEVGLGKTLIARGTIAKFALLRKEEGDDLVKVVYVCSNASIAEQNLNKLKITQELWTESISSSRLSMQHLNIFLQEHDEKIKNSYIQLIPLTPETSFRMTSGGGSVSERALMFALLKRIAELEHVKKGLEIIMIDNAKKAWDNWCKNNFETAVNRCNHLSDGEYCKYMCKEISRELATIQQSGMTYLSELIDACRKAENGVPYNRGIIGKLRVVFAKISLERLNPDLVIMDEFQRFKFLISKDNEDTETGMLAKKFFNNKETRILLLSATPYKMYSTMEEIDETLTDDHYQEFFDVMGFLFGEKDEAQFREIWERYSIRLKELAHGASAVLELKEAAENAMYNHVCRTERIESVGSADLIDDADVKTALQISEQDIKSYIQMQKLLDSVSGQRMPADYVKSCPYLLSFMRDYKLKQNIEAYFRDNPQKIGQVMRGSFFLGKKPLDAFEKIPCNNARLENIIHHTFDEGIKTELLLWVPASKPYYSPEGPFVRAEKFTKTLIFSAWEMVPRMIAAMLSYETERRTIGKLAKKEQREPHYFYREKDRYPRPKLNFALRNGEPASMALFCLTYPFKSLADCYNPIDCLNRHLTLKEITNEIKGKLSEKLATLPSVADGPVDQRWYYLAPLLMEGKTDESDVSDGEDSLEETDKKGFASHIKKLDQYRRQIESGEDLGLGKRPDDLLDVLADMAIASPAICAFRSYRKYREGKAAVFAGEIAQIFRNRMNTPDWTAVVDLCFGSKNDDAHWQNVLAYCKAGNLQAMFDEYLHLLSNGVDLTEDNALEVLHTQCKESMSIRTTVYKVDSYKSFKARINGQQGQDGQEDKRMISFRSHFAVAFTKGDGETKDADRKKSMRNAFNSPFRPFVLASTSIGQEGLDFHNYCRRIVHWNLPSNPIDLEQREGRINRFECLAIRQNVAKRYGDMEFDRDVWREMFKMAEECEHTEETSELIPYWGLTEKENMIKIERIVPMYPMSRDILSYERLIKILSLYRLTLGHARQEELLEYILKNCDEERQEEIKKYFINLSPYYKEKRDNKSEE